MAKGYRMKVGDLVYYVELGRTYDPKLHHIFIITSRPEYAEPRSEVERHNPLRYKCTLVALQEAHNDGDGTQWREHTSDIRDLAVLSKSP